MWGWLSYIVKIFSPSLPLNRAAWNEDGDKVEEILWSVKVNILKQIWKMRIKSEEFWWFFCFGSLDHFKTLSINYNFHMNNTSHFYQLKVITNSPTPQNPFNSIKPGRCKCWNHFGSCFWHSYRKENVVLFFFLMKNFLKNQETF
jgi:hypothetical protein